MERISFWPTREAAEKQASYVEAREPGATYSIAQMLSGVWRLSVESAPHYRHLDIGAFRSFVRRLGLFEPEIQIDSEGMRARSSEPDEAHTEILYDAGFDYLKGVPVTSTRRGAGGIDQKGKPDADL